MTTLTAEQNKKADITITFTKPLDGIKGFKGKEGETHWETSEHLLVGLGEQPTTETYRRGAGIGIITARKKEPRTITFSNTKGHSQATAEGALLAAYTFDEYKEKKTPEIAIINIPDAGKEELEGLQDLCMTVNTARTLANENSNIITPTRIVEEARRIAKQYGLECTILRRKELEREGLGLITAVGKGGADEPALIILEHKGSTEAPIAFIGKGVCFDSGGYNIKLQQMEWMRYDMSGAANTLALVELSAAHKIKKHILGIIPTAENLVDSNSYRPGDVYTAYNKVTVEIANTDAEGRLLLGDAIAYTVKKYKPQLIITQATLTGAVLSALGDYMAGLVSTDEKLAKEIISAGNETGEYVWQLPINKEYIDEMKGDKSTIKNLGYNDGKYAGTITGAAFLTFFTNGTPLAHLDIAGTAWMTKQRWYYEKGATGFGIRLLWEWLQKKK